MFQTMPLSPWRTTNSRERSCRASRPRARRVRGSLARPRATRERSRRTCLRHRRGVEESTRTGRCHTGLRHRRHLCDSRVVAAGRPLLAVVLERGDDLVFRPGRRRAAGFAPGAARLAGLAPELAPGSTGQPGLARRLFSRLARRHGVRPLPAKRQHDEPTPAPLEAEVEAPIQAPSQN